MPDSRDARTAEAADIPDHIVDAEEVVRVVMARP